MALPTVRPEDLDAYTLELLKKEDFSAVTLFEEAEGIEHCPKTKVITALEEQVRYWIYTFSTDQPGVTVRLVVDGTDFLVVGYL